MWKPAVLTCVCGMWVFFLSGSDDHPLDLPSNTLLAPPPPLATNGCQPLLKSLLVDDAYTRFGQIVMALTRWAVCCLAPFVQTSIRRRITLERKLWLPFVCSSCYRMEMSWRRPKQSWQDMLSTNWTPQCCSTFGGISVMRGVFSNTEMFPDISCLIRGKY